MWRPGKLRFLIGVKNPLPIRPAATARKHGPLRGRAGRQIRDFSRATRIASPEMFPEAEMLPHLICSRPILIGGANDEADQHGGA
jgi:hypothetical protein